MSNTNKKYLIIGRSASGKSTIADELCKRYNLVQVKSYTDRPPRDKELKLGASNVFKDNNTDHVFLSKEEMDSVLMEDIAAYTEINGARYCTTVDVLDKSDIYVIDPIGVQSIKKNCPQYEFVEIYIRVPKSVRKKRWIKRGGSASDFQKRLESEDEQFLEYETNSGWNYHLLNIEKTVNECVDKVKSWIDAEESKVGDKHD